MTDKIVSEYQQRLVRRELGHSSDSDVDDDELLDSLDDGFVDNYRERRMQELSDQFKQSRKQVEELGHGSLETLLSEEQVLKLTTTRELSLIHFFHGKFDKCAKMDAKLSTLAQKHLGTKFMRISVDDAPFLVTRLNVKVLPCVILYTRGVECGRIVGFDHLDYDPEKDDFTIESLEAYLLSRGMLKRKAQNYTRLQKRVQNEDEESDLDL